MNAEVHDAGMCEVSRQDARGELDRLLSDPRFHATERSRAILKYLVDHREAGNRQSVGAYPIAIDVLGRPSSFDAATDPIVRIEMSRLRNTLQQYYEAYGDGVLTLRLPKGRYVAEFSRGGLASADEGGGDEEEIDEVFTQAHAAAEAASDGTSTSMLRRRRIPFAVAALAALGAATGWYAMRPVFTEKPRVVVTMTAADERLAGEASVTRDYLLAALAQFGTITVSATSPTKTFADARSRPDRNTYAVDLKYYSDDDDRTVWWQVSDTADGDVLKSGIERVPVEGMSPAAANGALVAALTRRLATSSGVISGIERAEAAPGSLGNACVLRAEYSLDQVGASELADDETCLEKTVGRVPTDVEALATLARVKLARDPSQAGEALGLANRAVSLAPTSDRANIALMMAQFYAGRPKSAIEAGNRALALNPNNSDVSAKLGTVMFASGFYDSAVSLAVDSSKAVDAAPRDALLVLALDAYRRGDWSSASLLAEQVNCSDFVVRALRAAALGQLDSPQAAGRLADLRGIEPDFEKTFRQRVEARRYPPFIATSLQRGLAKAGANFVPDAIASAL